MYRVPKDLDLSEIVGKSSTQLKVGQFDLQFSFGDVDFLIESKVDLIREGRVIGHWSAGSWPSSSFFEMMNSEVTGFEIPNDRTIVIHLHGSLEVHMYDTEDEFECIQISMPGQNSWII